MANKQFLSVDIQPVGRRVEIQPGQTLLDVFRLAGVDVISLCGGEGWCESCLVKVISGEVSPPTSIETDSLGEERISTGYRLSCQTVPLTDVKVDIPPDSLSTPQRLQIEGREFRIPVDPLVRVVDLDLKAPKLSDLRDDTQRLLDGLSDAGYRDMSVSLSVLRDMSELIRKYCWSARVVLRESEVIALFPRGTDIYGIAVDIGTTKIAIYAVDLHSGEIVAKTGEMNPQIAYGEDVISRITYSREHKKGRTELQEVLIRTLNHKIEEICEQAGITSDQLVDAVVVGNTAMHHLFAGLPVDQLVFAPYLAAIGSAIDIRAKALGLEISPGAYVHLLPNIAGYVGADHAAVILSTKLWDTEEVVLAVDIGTNTEISLVHQGRITSCSCASGPAFEGAHITFGMRAAPGAIEKVQIINDEIKLFTIRDQPPVGICGSGILDVVSEMKVNNFMDEKGAIHKGAKFIREADRGIPELLLVPASESGNDRDITVSRKDINEIQLAKAAIRSGLEILLVEAGIRAEDVDRVLVAGAFGTYISIPNAIEIGMFPPIPLDRFEQVGNAAGMGAVQALISKPHRKLISKEIQKAAYVELTTYEKFQEMFMKFMYLH